VLGFGTDLEPDPREKVLFEAANRYISQHPVLKGNYENDSIMYFLNLLSKLGSPRHWIRRWSFRGLRGFWRKL